MYRGIPAKIVKQIFLLALCFRFRFGTGLRLTMNNSGIDREYLYPYSDVRYSLLLSFLGHILSPLSPSAIL